VTGQVQAASFLGLSRGALLAGAITACLLLAGLVTWVVWRSRSSPAERERKRRLAVHSLGRMCDGNIVDYHDGALHYSYIVGGIEYTASQEVVQLGEILPTDPTTAIGPGSVKYLPRNPANSIVVCEHWSGLRARPGSPGS